MESDIAILERPWGRVAIEGAEAAIVLQESSSETRDVNDHEAHPVSHVIWVDTDLVHANNYNPNTVAPPEMRLLELSIVSDMFTQPIVVWRSEDGYEVVDGFHRYRVGKKLGMKQLPLVVVNADRVGRGDRIASTIRHNRARGRHQVEGMSDIIQELARRNWSDKKIARELGMEPDEVLRLKQITGLAEMFADKEFSEAWEVTA